MGCAVGSGQAASSAAPLGPPVAPPQVGQSLHAVVAGAGDDKELRGAAAGAAGAFAKHCSPEELKGLLESGPLAAGSGRLAERIGSTEVRAGSVGCG